MRGSAFFSLIILSFTTSLCFSNAAFATEGCDGALEIVNGAAKKAELQLSSSAVEARAANVGSGPVHLTSSSYMRYIWVTHPTQDNHYAVVEKNRMGFGFSPVPVEFYELVKSDQVVLRSLDFSGDHQSILATFLARDSDRSAIVLKAASLANSEGQVSLVGDGGLTIEGIEETVNNFVVTPRAGTRQFWITDGSKKLRVVEIDGNSEVQLLDELEFDFAYSKLLKLHFYGDANRGYLRYEDMEGNQRVTLFQFEVSEEGNMVISIEEENSRQLNEGLLRSAVQPGTNYLFLSYADEIVVLGPSKDASLQEIGRLNTKKISQGREFVGIEFYHDATVEVIPAEGEDAKDPSKSTVRAFGPHRAIVLLRREGEEDIRLLWADVGQ